MPDTVRTLSYDSLVRMLSPRERVTHKGDYGHVFVLGGEEGTGGAVLMAGEAAARAGAGLTSVVTRSIHVAACMQRRPELMVTGLDNTRELPLLLARASVVVVGPGLGQSDWSHGVLLAALQIAAVRDLPVVLDADALNLLSTNNSLRAHGQNGKWILTPHAGEAARLLGISREKVEADREAAVLNLQAAYGGIVILKGPGTLLCYPQGQRLQIARCVHGNPGMASGGMGDVLSGILGGLLAQQFSLVDSARIGVCVHSKAADLAAARDGERGMLATDLLPDVRRLLNP